MCTLTCNCTCRNDLDHLASLERPAVQDIFYQTLSSYTRHDTHCIPFEEKLCGKEKFVVGCVNTFVRLNISCGVI
ncbi:hypothetical protein POVWA2_022830 [Plasmodium ovale wallikeri]|uniref:Uncharacterized protein n=1 Tax=Plasmodium ovale wallikeri TaxID=864142 RepID=A0A1A8YU37_PLAOA|nr:hypothetical protein POVWA2_022830 [Plasmodium ovale wallikeri]